MRIFSLFVKLKAQWECLWICESQVYEPVIGESQMGLFVLNFCFSTEIDGLDSDLQVWDELIKMFCFASKMSAYIISRTEQCILKTSNNEQQHREKT